MTALYILRWRLTTVGQALPRYAPRRDGNAPNAYIKAVLDRVAAWQAQDVDAPEQEGQLIQTYRVRSSLGSAVIVRSGPRARRPRSARSRPAMPFTGFRGARRDGQLPGFGREQQLDEQRGRHQVRVDRPVRALRST